MFIVTIAGVLASMPLKIGLIAAAFALATGNILCARFRSKWLAGALHVTSAIVVLVAVASFLSVTPRPWHRSFLNEHDTFHYYFSAKYSGELGYDRLYHCTLVALDELSPSYHANVKTLRSMGHYRHVNKSWYLERPGICTARFTTARWQQFKDDVLAYHRTHRPNWRGFLRDKGYNATPAWTIVGKLVAERIPVEPWQRFNWVGVFDLLAVLLAFGLVFAALGWRWAVVGLVFFCGCFALTLTFIRGSLLRLDWLAALIAAVAMLAWRRHALAGALFGYATMVRVFPVLFLFGPLVLGVAQLIRKRAVPRDALALLLGFVLTSGLLFGASVALTGARDGWQAWGEKMVLHNGDISTMRLGLGPLLMYRGESFEADLKDENGKGNFRSIFVPKKQRVVASMQPLHLAIAAVALVFLAAAFVRRPRSYLEAVGLSLPVVFLLVSPTFYYYCLLVPLVVALAAQAERRHFLLLPLGLLCGAEVCFHLLHHYIQFEYRTYSLMSVGLAVAAAGTIAAAWLAPRKSI